MTSDDEPERCVWRLEKVGVYIEAGVRKTLTRWTKECDPQSRKNILEYITTPPKYCLYCGREIEVREADDDQ